MLDLSAVDLDDVATALDDHSSFGSWWIDTGSGEVWLWSGEADDDPEFDPDLRPGAQMIEPVPPSVGYGDMEDFIARVSDRRAADLLDRAIAGRGAFRRFKDTLFEFPELREAWFRFRDARMRRRAIEFLVDYGLVGHAAAEVALAELNDPPVGDGAGSADPRDVAGAVAADLRQLYGVRLVDVVLYGSHARGDANPHSDVDLAVILDDLSSPWDELRRMDDILWHHTLASGLTVSATPISRMAWTEAQRPLVRAAKSGGRPSRLSGASDEGLTRARQEIAAAELLGANGFGAQAVSRAYYAAFYAAEAALLRLDETRAQHGGVVSAFGRLLVRDRSVDEEAGRLLRSLFERRSQADYELGEVPIEEAQRAITDAAVVVEAVDRWFGQDSDR